MKKNLFRCFWCLTLLSFGALAAGNGPIIESNKAKLQSSVTRSASANYGGPLVGLGMPVLLLDVNNTALVENSRPLNIATSYSEKTLAIAFTTGADVTSRQSLYDQSKPTHGINAYVENGQLYMNVYSIDSAYGDYGFKSVVMDVQPNTDYTAMMVYEGKSDNTGTIDGYLNGVHQGTTTGVGILQQHWEKVPVGYNNNTVFNGTVSYTNYPFLGSTKRVVQYNMIPTAEQRVLIENLANIGHDSERAFVDIDGPALDLADPVIGPIPNDKEINANSTYPDKTHAVAFTTSSDITTLQMLYEQGSGYKGLSMYIKDAKVHMNVYAVYSPNGNPVWGYKTVSADISPNTDYQALLVMDGEDDFSGTLTGYLNGVYQGVDTDVGILTSHSGEIGVGLVNYQTVIDGVVVSNEHRFTGTFKHIAQFNDVFTANDIALLMNYQLGDPEPLDLAVEIASPQTLATVGYSPVTVTGSVAGDISELTLNGVPVTADGAGNFSAPVALTEGFNTIIARVTDSQGVQVTDSISLSLDLTPPYLTIDSHTDFQTVFTNTVTVTGLVNDIVRGTVEEQQAAVSVNGVVAEVANRSYAAKDVPLVEGQNVITVTGVDQASNSISINQTIIYQVPTARNVAVISGQDQTATIGAKTTDMLKVLVTDASGQPVAGENVVFRVIQGAGVVGAEGENYGRAIVATTDASGHAETLFQLGYRTGVANHKVRAQVVGYEPEVIFHASAESTIGDKLSVNSGNNQRGIAGQPLPAPFIVAVTDAGANVVSGSRVRFDVVSGDGAFGVDGNGDAITSIEQITDSDGRATVEYTLGALTGLDRQRVQATLLDAPEGQTLTASFMATAFVAGDPGQTSITGAVVDNQDKAIPGVTVRVEGTNRTAITDSEGRFTITQVPVGPVHIIADGSTASISGEFPSLSYHLVTVPGAENPLSAPIYMVKLDTDNAVYAGPEDVSLTLDKFPGFQLDIAKDSITFPDGSREGLVSVTAVNASKVPMAPPNGMQPQFIVTIQPVGATFDPPARLSLPNVDGHAPGAQVEMYSFDHDLEEFVAIGLGTVNEDGSQISSNVGVGVVKAGWHCGSQPGGSGSAHNCATCFRCTGTFCARDSAQDNNPLDEQVEGDCKTALCVGSRTEQTDAPNEDTIVGDCRMPGCDGSTPKGTHGVNDGDVPVNDPFFGDCRRPGCSNGKVVDLIDNSDINPADAVCRECAAGSLMNKSDGTSIAGEPCKECQGGVIANKQDGTRIEEATCMECQGGVLVACAEPPPPDEEPKDHLPPNKKQDDNPLGLDDDGDPDKDTEDDPDQPQKNLRNKDEPDDDKDLGGGDCPTSRDSFNFSSNPASLSGAKHFNSHCLSLSYKTETISIGLSYDTRWADLPVPRANGLVGQGWTVGHSQGLDLTQTTQAITYINPVGVEYKFTPRDLDNDGSTDMWMAKNLSQSQSNVSITPQNSDWLVSYQSGKTETFDAQGFMKKSCSVVRNTCRLYRYSNVTEASVDYLAKTIHLRELGGTVNKQSMALYIRKSDNRLVYIRDVTNGLDPLLARQVSLQYDANGRLAVITQPDGAITSYEYDSSGYITAQIDAHMQGSSGTANAGWRHEIVYQAPNLNGNDTPLRRVAEEVWKDDAGVVQRKEKMVWGNNTVTLETWDHTNATPTLLLSERFDYDGAGRLVKKHLPNSTSLFTEYVYCITANEPTACAGEKNDNKLRRILMPDGSQIEYSYDAKGRLLSTTRGKQL